MAAELRSVSWLNRYVATRLGDDPILSDLSVVGEISGGKLYPSGHFYFTLKDEQAQVSCVFFSMARQQPGFRPQSGMKVVCRARAGLYQKDGRFQLNVIRMEEEGVGDLHRRFLETKDRLEAEGLFEQTRKRPLPFWPKRIGVVTSAAGAVLSDILFVLRQEAPSFDLLLYPVAVQGSDAPRQIAAAIARANLDRAVDVLIVGRGGGSFEDLYAFNEEVVVRAVAASAIPVIAAVGHETDVTLTDFAADLRMPTPSAAAMQVMPSRHTLSRQIRQSARRIETAFAAQVAGKKQILAAWQRQQTRLHPSRQLEARRQFLDGLSARIDRSMARMEARRREHLQHAWRLIRERFEQTMLRHRFRLGTMTGRLRALNPYAVLERGYALVTDERNAVIGSARELQLEDRVTVRFFDGTAGMRVISVKDDASGQEGEAHEHK